LRALAERYAGALADVALEQDVADRVSTELQGFQSLLDESGELREFLASPVVSRANKHAVIEKLVARMEATRTVRNFLFVVADHRHMRLLGEIAEAYRAQLDKRRGVTQAKVTSADEVVPASRAELGSALDALTGRNVEARFSTDAALIGGVVVSIGSTIYDGSVRAQLERLRVRLASE